MVWCALQGADVYKSVFLIFFQGDQLKTKVRKICEGSVQWCSGLLTHLLWHLFKVGQ